MRVVGSVPAGQGWIRVIVSVVLVLSLAACSSSSGGSGSADGESPSKAAAVGGDATAGVTEVTVPYLLGLTGAAASIGKSVREGALLAQDVINEEGGIESLGGAKIRVELADHQTKNEVAFSLTQKFAADGTIPMVVGAASSGQTIAATEVAERQRLPFLVDGSNDDQITSRGFTYLVSLSQPMSWTAEQTVAALREIKDENDLQMQRAVTLVHEEPPGPTTLTAALDALEAEGFEVVKDFRYSESTTDFTPIVSQIKDLAPDLIVMQSYPQSALLITRTFEDLNVDVPAMVGIMAGHTLSSYGQELGDASTGTAAATYWTADVQNKGSDRLREAWEASGHDGEPDAFVAFGYRSVIAAAEILNAAGSTDRETVLEAMNAVDVEPGDWPLYPIPGGVKFDEAGRNTRDQIVLGQWSDGQLLSTWPFADASADFTYPIP